MTARPRAWKTAALLLLILFGVAANVVVTLKLSEQVRSIQQAQPQRPGLPCPAIPTRLILEDPECAQKLLMVMNVTNVRVLANGSQLPDLDPAIKDRLATLGMPANRSRSH
jgi:hypothetical protein